MKTYIISDFTGYDNDEMLYFTKIGYQGKRSMPLLYTVWGLTKEISRQSAELLVEYLTYNKVKST